MRNFAKIDETGETNKTYKKTKNVCFETKNVCFETKNVFWGQKCNIPYIQKLSRINRF